MISMLGSSLGGMTAFVAQLSAAPLSSSRRDPLSQLSPSIKFDRNTCVRALLPALVRLFLAACSCALAAWDRPQLFPWNPPNTRPIFETLHLCISWLWFSEARADCNFCFRPKTDHLS